MHKQLLEKYYKTDGWYTPTVGEKRVDKSQTPRYNKDNNTTTYDLNDAWKSDHEKELRYAGDSARESVDKGLDYVPKFMKDAPKGTNYSDVQSASVKLSLANDTNDNELKQSAFDELTGLLSTVNKEQYLAKARPLQEFVDAKDTYDYNHKNYTTTKNADKAFSVTTYDLQQFLNKEGHTDKFGNPLKEDGIMGAKTQYAYDQMLEAENAKSSTEQPVNPTKPASAQVDVPAPAQAAEPTPTQLSETETANFDNVGLERWRNSSLPVRTGTREQNRKSNNLTKDNESDSRTYVNENGVTKWKELPYIVQRLPVETQLFREKKISADVYKAFDKLSQRWFYADTEEARKEISGIANSVRKNNYKIKDCTSEANKQLWENGQSIRQKYALNAGTSSLVTAFTGILGGLVVSTAGIGLIGIDWYTKVDNKGVWDYKVNNSEESWLPKENYFFYYDQLISKADFGNLNYGYTGTILGLTPETLYEAGGKVAPNPTQYEIDNYYSDSEIDHYWIKKGIEQANKRGYYGSIELPVDLIFNLI